MVIDTQQEVHCAAREIRKCLSVSHWNGPLRTGNNMQTGKMKLSRGTVIALKRGTLSGNDDTNANMGDGA